MAYFLWDLDVHETCNVDQNSIDMYSMVLKEPVPQNLNM